MADREKDSGFQANDVEEVIGRHYDQIYRYCFWKVRDRFEAQDLTQETFLRFVQSLPGYSDQGKPLALLYTIARNLCINWYKSRRPIPVSEPGNMPFGRPDLERLEDKITLEQCIKELTEEQQEVLLLRFGQQLQINEIAKVMGISRFAVRYRMRTALDALHRKLEKGGFVI